MPIDPAVLGDERSDLTVTDQSVIRDRQIAISTLFGRSRRTSSSNGGHRHQTSSSAQESVITADEAKLAPSGAARNSQSSERRRVQLRGATGRTRSPAGHGGCQHFSRWWFGGSSLSRIPSEYAPSSPRRPSQRPATAPSMAGQTGCSC